MDLIRSYWVLYGLGLGSFMGLIWILLGLIGFHMGIIDTCMGLISTLGPCFTRNSRKYECVPIPGRCSRVTFSKMLALAVRR